MLPEDPMMLLSYVNTKLRDFYPDLKSFCQAENVPEETVKEKLAQIAYEYDEKWNKFI